MQERWVCEYCGQEYTRNRRTSRFCSERCQRQWWAENRDKHKEYTYTCQNCGKRYQAKEKNRDKFCSQECYFAHIAVGSPENIARKKAREEKRKKTTIKWAECTECGKRFRQRHRRLTCSRECGAARARRLYAEYAKELKGQSPAICKECGKRFISPYGDKRRLFCSTECSRKHNGRIHKKTRRARKKTNGMIETIDPMVVFERDNWKCGICGKEVDRVLEYPDPMSASLDHIVALALGGPHTYQNVQLAHLACNINKGARAQGQMRLGLIR